MFVLKLSALVAVLVFFWAIGEQVYHYIKIKKKAKK